MTVLVISPHLDDAAFSCGGTIARFLDAGCRVVLATVFTATVPSPSGFALECQLDKGITADADYMALRRAEDAEFSSRIGGAEPVHLALPEAPHRGYDSAAALFGGAHRQDRIGSRLASLMADLDLAIGPDLILSPLAVGSHVDHQWVRATAAAYLPWSDRIAFYQELPYALRAGHRTSGEEVLKVCIDEFMDRKIYAASAYASQVPFQFGTADAMAGTFREIALQGSPDDGPEIMAEYLVAIKSRAVRQVLLNNPHGKETDGRSQDVDSATSPPR